MMESLTLGYLQMTCFQEPKLMIKASKLENAMQLAGMNPENHEAAPTLARPKEFS